MSSIVAADAVVANSCSLPVVANSITANKIDLSQVVPIEMRSRKQWLTWKANNGTKVPIGKTNDPSTWHQFEDIAHLPKIAFVFSSDDPLCGVDVDGCIVDGEFTDWSKPILDRFRGIAYCEISPSGKGVKLTTKAKKPEGSTCIKKMGEGKQQIECYDNVRFWAVTGNVVQGFENIGDGQAAIDWLITEHLHISVKPVATKASAKSNASINTSNFPTARLFKRAQAYADRVPAASLGNLRNTVFKLSGHLHSFVSKAGDRLTEEMVFRVLESWNARNSIPLRDDELREAVENGRKNGTLPQDKLEDDTNPSIGVPEGRTDNANATAFVDKFQSEFRYCPSWGTWIVWDGSRWKIDRGNVAVMQKGRLYASNLWTEFGRLAKDLDASLKVTCNFVSKSNDRRSIEAMVRLGCCDERIVINHTDLDQKPFLLNVGNGTLNLVTGVLQRHEPNDHLTQIANVEFVHGAKSRRWNEMFELYFDGDSTMIRYLQQLLGYSISGETGEAILPICYGKNGNNGKSTIWNTVVALLGDYGSVAPSKLLMGTSNEHPTELADLFGKRLVAISEPEQGSKLREARVKELTGDARIKARRCREDYWEFERTHKFWMSSNHKPVIDGDDGGIWRRIKLIHFDVDLTKKVEKVIPDYFRVLAREEGSGILNWLLEGYQDYKRNGFVEPKQVTEAVASFRGESNQMERFVADRCVVDSSESESSSELHAAYKNWGGELSQRQFVSKMQGSYKHGKATSGPLRNKQVFFGLRLAI